MEILNRGDRCLGIIQKDEKLQIEIGYYLFSNNDETEFYYTKDKTEINYFKDFDDNKLIASIGNSSVFIVQKCISYDIKTFKKYQIAVKNFNSSSKSEKVKNKIELFQLDWKFEKIKYLLSKKHFSNLLALITLIIFFIAVVTQIIQCTTNQINLKKIIQIEDVIKILTNKNN